MCFYQPLPSLKATTPADFYLSIRLFPDEFEFSDEYAVAFFIPSSVVKI